MSKIIEEIFSDIADKYDIMGHIFSFGVDGIWRKIAANEAIIESSEYAVLDVATGTGSLVLDIAEKACKYNKSVCITGVDFNKDMLKIAKKKIDAKIDHKAKYSDIKINLKLDDAMKLEKSGSSYDVVTAGFLLRNVDDAIVFVHGLKKVLKSGGKFILLEMGKTDDKFLDFLYGTYFAVIRLAGSLINKKAYWWLTRSIMKFSREKMIDILKDNGFEDIKIKNLPFKIGFMITGKNV